MQKQTFATCHLDWTLFRWADEFVQPHPPWALRKFPSFPNRLQMDIPSTKMFAFKKSSGTLLQSGHYLSSHPTFVKIIENAQGMWPVLQMPSNASNFPVQSSVQSSAEHRRFMCFFEPRILFSEKKHPKWQGPRSQMAIFQVLTKKKHTAIKLFLRYDLKVLQPPFIFFLKCPSCVFFWSKCH